MKCLTAMAAAMVALAGGAAAAERLSYDGVALPGQAITAGAPLEYAIDAAGDEVLSVHTMLRPASTNIILVRDMDGYWAEWDGDRENLPESAARRDGDVLVYKILQTPPPGVTAMTVTVAYRTPEGLKFGWFEAAQAPEGSN